MFKFILGCVTILFFIVCIFVISVICGYIKSKIRILFNKLNTHNWYIKFASFFNICKKLVSNIFCVVALLVSVVAIWYSLCKIGEIVLYIINHF